MSKLDLDQIGVQELSKDELFKNNGGWWYAWVEMWGGVNIARLNLTESLPLERIIA